MSTRYRVRIPGYKKKVFIRQKPNIGRRVRQLESNVEYKFNDVTRAVAAPVVEGEVLLLNGIAKGSDSDEHEGDQINIVSVQYKLQGFAAAGANNGLRFMIVQDKQANGTALAIPLVLQNNTDVQKMQSPLNLDNKFRFTVLCDKMLEYSGDGKAHVFSSAYKKVSIKTRYSDDTALIGGINTNSIFAILIGQSTGGSVTFTTRIRYTDS